MGEEGRSSAKRAVGGPADAIRSKAEVQSSSDLDRPEVHGLSRCRHRQTQCFMDLGAHLIAVTANGRTQVKKEIGRLGTENLNHSPHPFPEDPRRRSPPSRMEEGHAPGSRIQEKHGNTVRNGNSQEHPGGRSQVAVRRSLQRQTMGEGGVDVQIPTMDLTGMHNARTAQRPSEQLPILPGSRPAHLPENAEVTYASLGWLSCGPLNNPGEA